MEYKDIDRGETLTMSLKIQSTQTKTIVPAEYHTISLTQFSLQVHVLNVEGSLSHSVFFRFSKLKLDTDETIRVTSEAMSIKNRTFKNDNAWVLVYHNKGKNGFEIDIKMQVIKPTLNKFFDLYNDVDMSDFELRVDDGSVRFHRLVLALSSPVLKTMLSGKWKDTTQGHVEVPGVSKNTIQQFKDFIYKSVVPENVSLELLSLASYYMMTELEEICLEKIADSLTSENTWRQLEYCVSHKLTKLLSVILNRLKCKQDDDNVFVKWLNA